MGPMGPYGPMRGPPPLPPMGSRPPWGPQGVRSRPENKIKLKLNFTIFFFSPECHPEAAGTQAGLQGDPRVDLRTWAPTLTGCTQ